MEIKVNNHPAPGLPDPAKSAFHLVVFFKDGKRRDFYAYHTAYNAETKKIIIDDKTGLTKLQRLIMHKFSGRYKTALIYYIDPVKKIMIKDQERRSEQQIMKYCYDRLIQISDFGWQYVNGAIRIKFNDQKSAG